MRKIIIALICCLSLKALSQDTLILSRSECEAVFLKENLLLMAEKLNIPKAEAQIQQAKLWPNPNFTFDQVNFWATDRQTGGQEVVPPLWGNFGRNRQFGAELEQLVQTAGKRGKMIALEKVNAEKSREYFQDLLRNLKIEFRKQLTELQYLQLSKKILEKQLLSVRQLTDAYDKQAKLGNIPKGELVRLQVQEAEIRKEMYDLNVQTGTIQSRLKGLMHIDPEKIFLVEEKDFSAESDSSREWQLNDLLLAARENRPDLKLANLEEKYYEKLYAYQKAQRVPDLTLKAAYDRNGNAMLDFVGFGASIDLPVFNRNQGNIKAAKFGREQARLLSENVNNTIENDIAGAYRNFRHALDFRQSARQNDIGGLDDLLEAYTKNFRLRNVSLLEYLDFLEAYMSGKKSQLDMFRSFRDAAEELNYAVGKDIIN